MYYLYVKQHSVTGLKYFGVTQKRDPFRYTGSGVYWKRHLTKHGPRFITEVWGFDTFESCQSFADIFSKTNNIVESLDWANLKTEDGGRGGSLGISSRILIGQANKGRFLGKTYEEIYGFERAKALRESRAATTKGKDNRGAKNPMFGKTHSDELKARYSREKSGSGNPTYGWKWITDGVTTVKVPPTHVLEGGWRYGRVNVQKPRV